MMSFVLEGKGRYAKGRVLMLHLGALLIPKNLTRPRLGLGYGCPDWKRIVSS